MPGWRNWQTHRT